MEFLNTGVTFCSGYARGQRLRLERARTRERGERWWGPASTQKGPARVSAWEASPVATFCSCFATAPACRT
jgi:hypothetical protein